MKRIVKRPLSVDGPSLRYGIFLAAEVAADYDNLSSHDHLVSECILGKLNVLKRRPKKNPAAAKLKRALDQIEQKVRSVEGMARFMANSIRQQRRRKPKRGNGNGART